jgi:alkylation response protein AidB-like acyl-CoA dehydrogenase
VADSHPGARYTIEAVDDHTPEAHARISDLRWILKREPGSGPERPPACLDALRSARLIHQLGAMDCLIERAARLAAGRRTRQLLQKGGGASRW